MSTKQISENAEKWLQALESGEYKQGQGRLTTILSDGSKHHCCLGVACELYAQEYPDQIEIGVEALEAYDTGVNAVVFDGQRSYSPEKIVNWLGLTDDQGSIEWGLVPEYDSIEREFSDLAELNDSEYYNFADIAAFIRRNPTAVFKEFK